MTSNQNHKDLVNHCRAVLDQHHDYAVASSPTQTPRSQKQFEHHHERSPVPFIARRDSDKDEQRWEQDLPSIHKIVDEDDLINTYFEKNKISTESDKTFIQEVVRGCVRWKKIIQGALSLFYSKTGCRYLKSDHNLFAVFFYLVMIRLQDIQLSELSRFMSAFDTNRMYRMFSFLFSADNLSGCLMKEWKKVLDEAYIKINIISPIMKCMPDAKVILADLKSKVELGEKTKKSTRPITEPQPFLLTKPRPRKFMEPPVVLSTLVKARKIPKAVYKGTEDKNVLEAKRRENRERQKAIYEEAAKTQFHIAKKPAVSEATKKKIEAIKMERKEIVLAGIVKPKPPPANMNEPIPVKLTMASILREDALLKKQKEEAKKVLLEAEIGLKDQSEFMKWKEEMRLKEEEEKRLELERRRLEVQIVHEEAMLAREEILKENKQKVQETKEEIAILKTIIHEQRKEEDEENKKKIAEVQEIMENVKIAKKKIEEENKQKVAEVMAESEAFKLQRLKEEEEELARKQDIIRQIKLLEQSASSMTAPKVVNLTETSQIGLLTEMSVIELQERLAILKVREAEEEAHRREKIYKQKQEKMEVINRKLEELEQRRMERRLQRDLGSVPQTSRPTSVAAMSDISSAKSFNPVLEKIALSKDPGVKELQEKLRLKRQARLTKKKSGSFVTAAVTAATNATSTTNASIDGNTEHNHKATFEKSWKLKLEPLILDDEELLKKVIASEIERYGPLHHDSKQTRQHSDHPTPALANLVHTLKEKKQPVEASSTN